MNGRNVRMEQRSDATHVVQDHNEATETTAAGRLSPLAVALSIQRPLGSLKDQAFLDMHVFPSVLVFNTELFLAL